MVRVVGLESTPNILGDSTEALDRPRRRREEGSFDVAQVPPGLQMELERRRATTPQTPPPAATPPQATVRTTRSEADIIREQAELRQKQEELQRSQGAAKRQQQAAIAARFEPALNTPAPQFEAPKESFAQFGALAAMMMVMGAMGGGKGLTSATGAMNAMAGMMKGYQEGRKEAYNNAKMQFEQNYKSWQANKSQIKEAFARALKFAPQDIQSATDKAVAELNAAGATTLAASVKTQGLQATANTYAAASDKADQEIETIGSSIARMTGQTAQRRETGVQLAGDPQRGLPLTLEEIKRRQRDLETEQKIRAAETKAAEAARRASPRESSDPQFIVVPGYNNDQPFRATKAERDQITGAGLPIQYPTVRPPKDESVKTFAAKNRETGETEFFNIRPDPQTGQYKAPEGYTLVGEAGRGRGQTQAGQNALTFASRVFGNIQNAAQDLINISAMPATATTPVLSGIIGADPNTVSGSLVALGARSITRPEARAFDQLSQQLGAALSRIEAQGLASGSTNATIRTFDALRPKAGDNAINMALYLAKVKQEIITGISVHEEMQGATDGQKKKNRDAVRQIDEVIPFDLKDVIDVIRKNKLPLSDSSQKLLRVQPIAPNLQLTTGGNVISPLGGAAPRTPTETPVPAAPARAAQPERKATFNGRTIVVRGGRWVYEDSGEPAQ